MAPGDGMDDRCVVTQEDGVGVAYKGGECEGFRFSYVDVRSRGHQDGEIATSCGHADPKGTCIGRNGVGWSLDAPCCAMREHFPDSGESVYIVVWKRLGGVEQPKKGAEHMIMSTV